MRELVTYLEGFYSNVGGIEKSILSIISELKEYLKDNIREIIHANIPSSSYNEKRTMRCTLDEIYNRFPDGTILMTSKKYGFRKVCSSIPKQIGWENIIRQEGYKDRSDGYVNSIDLSIRLYDYFNRHSNIDIEYDSKIVKEGFYKNTTGMDFKEFTPENTSKCKKIVEKIFGNKLTDADNMYNELTKFSATSFSNMLSNFPERYGFAYKYDAGYRNDVETNVVYFMREGEIKFIEFWRRSGSEDYKSNSGTLEKRDYKHLFSSLKDTCEAWERNPEFRPVFVSNDNDYKSIVEI